MQLDKFTPDPAIMLKGVLTPAEWLTYYENYWTSVAIARTVDVQADLMRKAKDGDELVQDDGNSAYTPMAPLPVKMRLEKRKMALESSLEIIASIKALKALPEGDLEKMWTPEFLAVAADVAAPENFVQFAVTPGKSITDEEGTTVTGDEKTTTVVMLDPNDEQVLAWIKDGSITPMSGEAAAEEAAPAAVDPALASFTVQAGKSVVTADGVTHAENTTVDLDPEGDQAKEWVAAGAIAPTVAPGV